MPTLALHIGDHTTEILVERGATARLSEIVASFLKGRPAVVVSDATVATLYAEQFATALGCETIHTFPDGEASKSLTELERLYGFLHEQRLPRDGVLIAVGGGVVSDLAGLAAATWLRGIPWIVIPTTLLAMVDASIGGKVAVDFRGTKNLIGAFHHPMLVLSDPALLATLPEEAYLSGCAEILKCACLDADFFAWLSESWDSLLRRDPAAEAEAIQRTIGLKVGIVTRDHHERGERQLLNLGHTLGHAVEAEAAGALSHGASVAIGLMFVTLMAERLGQTDGEFTGAVSRMARALVPKSWSPPAWETLQRFLARDKKRGESGLRWVVPSAAGLIAVSDAESVDLEDLWSELRLSLRA